MPSVSPLATAIFTCCTALTMPRRVANSTVRSLTSSSGSAFIVSRPPLRIDQIAQTIAEQVEAYLRARERPAGKESHPPLAENDVGRALRHHDSPFGRRRLDAEPDERQAGGIEDGVAHGQRHLHHHDR